MRRCLLVLPVVAALALASVPGGQPASASGNNSSGLTTAPAPGGVTITGNISGLTPPVPEPGGTITPTQPPSPAPPSNPTCDHSVTVNSTTFPPGYNELVSYSIPVSMSAHGVAPFGPAAYSPTNEWGTMNFPTDVILGAGLIDTHRQSGFGPVLPMNLTPAEVQEGTQLGLYVTSSGLTQYVYNPSTGLCSWTEPILNTVTRVPMPGGVPFTIPKPTPPPLPAGTLLANQVGGWTWGSEQLLPADKVTYVGMPTCGSIVGSTVPTATEYLVATSNTVQEPLTEGGVLIGTVNEWVVYIITITPTTISWNYGDGLTTGTGAYLNKPTEEWVNSAPPTGSYPSYDPDNQLWSNSVCNNGGTSFHYYTAINNGRTIQPSMTDTASGIAEWETGTGAGITTVPLTVPCAAGDGTTSGADCVVSSKWPSVTVAVRQIEGIPVLPAG